MLDNARPRKAAADRLRVGHTVMLRPPEKLLIRRAAVEGGYRSASELMRLQSVAAARRILDDAAAGVAVSVASESAA